MSREIDPTQPAVLTVGSIHSSAKGNIIPDEVKMQLTLRSYREDVRDQLIEGIKRFGSRAWLRPTARPRPASRSAKRLRRRSAPRPW